MAADKDSDFLVGFVLGGLIGAGLAFFLAPRWSEETRQQVMERGIELKGKAEEVSSRARESAEGLIGKGRLAVDEQKVKLQEAIAEGKEAAAQKQEELMAKLETMRKQTES